MDKDQWIITITLVTYVSSPKFDHTTTPINCGNSGSEEQATIVLPTMRTALQKA